MFPSGRSDSNQPTSKGNRCLEREEGGLMTRGLLFLPPPVFYLLARGEGWDQKVVLLRFHKYFTMGQLGASTVSTAACETRSDLFRVHGQRRRVRRDGWVQVA